MTQTWKARPLGPLAIEHSTVTVAATAAALGTGDVAACIVQAAATNSGTVYLGGEGVTSSDYGIALTAGSSVPIVEDEYQTSLRFRGEPLPTLRSLDARGLTVTVSTMSKGLFPALRIGWIAGGEELLKPKIGRAHV